MAARRVTHSHKNPEGEIVGLGWDENGILHYAPRDEAIRDIISGTNRYYVDQVRPAVDVIIVTDTGPAQLQAEAPDRCDNNLNNLPDYAMAIFGRPTESLR